jgi:RNA polymerase sigma-70 factor (ECF subfamily)
LTDQEFFETYNKDIYRSCFYILGNSSDAEDACQEVFIKALRQDWRKIEFQKVSKNVVN